VALFAQRNAGIFFVLERYFLSFLSLEFRSVAWRSMMGDAGDIGSCRGLGKAVFRAFVLAWTLCSEARRWCCDCWRCLTARSQLRGIEYSPRALSAYRCCSVPLYCNAPLAVPVEMALTGSEAHAVTMARMSGKESVVLAAGNNMGDSFLATWSGFRRRVNSLGSRCRLGD
jgi:hypothetical protein